LKNLKLYLSLTAAAEEEKFFAQGFSTRHCLPLWTFYSQPRGFCFNTIDFIDIKEIESDQITPLRREEAGWSYSMSSSPLSTMFSSPLRP
jgi:hypothetical protein